MGDYLMNKHRPNCNKIQCNNLSDVILSLDSWGYLYFCAEHALRNIQWESAIRMESTI